MQLSASKLHLQNYYDFCIANGIKKPIDLLAEVVRQSHPKGLTAQQLTSYLISPQSVKDLEKVLAKKSLISDVTQFNNLVSHIWGFNSTQLFNPRFRPMDVGTFARFKARVANKPVVVNKWTRSLAVSAVVKALNSIEDISSVFPFSFQSGPEKSYEKFKQACSNKFNLPDTDAIFGKRNVFTSIFDFNEAIAKKLKLDYVAPTKETIIKDVLEWLKRQGREPESIMLIDIDELIDANVIDRLWIHHRGGIFKSRREFVQSVREHDGVEKLKIGYDVKKLTRDEVLAAINKAFPRKTGNDPSIPPTTSDLEGLAKKKIVPYASTIIGENLMFSSIREVHIGLGYPRIRITHKYDKCINAPTRLCNAQDEIAKVIHEMYKVGMVPSNGVSFSRGEFDFAQQIGIVDHSARIIGGEGWNLTDQSHYEAFRDSYRTKFSQGYEDMSSSEKETADAMAFDALYEAAMLHPDIDLAHFSENDIKLLSSSSECPTSHDLDVIFASPMAVAVMMKLVYKNGVSIDPIVSTEDTGLVLV